MAANDDLARHIEQVAATIEGIERNVGAAGVGYGLRGVLFAVVGVESATFRLRPDIAEAALATPDVRRSDRGPGWVTLVPHAVDQFALDRAGSWFAAAARYASETAPGRRAN